MAAKRGGVVHRDVKPGTSFPDRHTVLVDFGIVTLDDAATLTHDGRVAIAAG